MLKKIIILIIMIITIWTLVFVVNICRCMNYQNPVNLFCIHTITDEYSEKYKYIGYDVYVSKKEGKIIQTEMKFLNIKIFETEESHIIKRIENVKMEVIKDSINEEGLTIIITDNNEFPFGWSDVYKIEKKIDNNWKEVEFENSIICDIDNIRDEKNQINFKLNWSKYYEQLSSGTYRIVKNVYDGEKYEDVYSNEFEINK